MSEIFMLFLALLPALIAHVRTHTHTLVFEGDLPRSVQELKESIWEATQSL